MLGRHRVTVGVTNAQQHAELLRGRANAMQRVVDVFTSNGVDLVVCTHPLKVCYKLVSLDANQAKM